MGSAVVGCAEEWGSPKPTTLFGLRTMAGKDHDLRFKISKRWVGRVGQRASRQDTGSVGVRVGVAEGPCREGVGSGAVGGLAGV